MRKSSFAVIDPTAEHNEEFHAAARQLNFKRELVAAGLLQEAAARFATLPQEWCYTQFCDAAAFVLDLQTRAMRHRLSLASISPRHISFHRKQPFYNQSLDLVPDRHGAWGAYEAFCRLFLAPLFLTRTAAARPPSEQLSLLEASTCLGIRSYFNLDALLHIHLHARAQRDLPGGFFLRSGEERSSRTKFDLVESLRKTVANLRRKKRSGAADLPASQIADRARYQFVKQVVGLWTPEAVAVLGSDFGTHSRVLQAESVPCAVLHPSPQQAERLYTARASSTTPIITSQPLRVLERWNAPLDLAIALDLPGLLAGFALDDAISMLHRYARLILIECQPDILAAFLSCRFTPVKMVSNPWNNHQLVLLKSI